MVRDVVATLAISLAGCALGGATDDTPPRRDAIGLPEDETEDSPSREEDTGVIYDATADDDSKAAADSAAVTDSAPPAADTACAPACTACGGDDGCGGKCATGPCMTGGEKCVSGTCVAATRSYLSPGSYAFGTAFARGSTITIASERASTIRYTLDGSAPSATSSSLPSPADLFVATSGTVLRWFSDTGAAEAVQSFTVNINPADQTKFGFMIEKVVLNGTGPVIVVAPGTPISGTALYQGWNSSTCEMCRMQLIYGIGTAAADCLYDYTPKFWPGTKVTGSIKGLTAPSTPGVHKLNVAYTLQNSCADGLATSPIGSRPTMAVGVVVVK